MTNNTEPARSAAALRVAYMRRAHIRRNSHLREQFYKVKITPSMVGMSLASVIQSLNRRRRYPHPLKRTTR